MARDHAIGPTDFFRNLLATQHGIIIGRDLVITSGHTDEAVLDPASVTFIDTATAAGFRITVVSRTRKPEMPAAGTYLEAATRLGLTPAECTVIENAREGIHAGRRAEFGLVIGIGHGAPAEKLLDFGADFTVDDLGDLIPLIRTARGNSPDPHDTAKTRFFFPPEYSA